MEKLAKQITGDKIQELNDKIGKVDSQVLRFWTTGNDSRYILNNLITDYLGFDDVELISHYSTLLVGYKEEYQELVKEITDLELEIPHISIESLLQDLNDYNNDITYLVDRLKDIKNSMLKKEYMQ